MRKRAQTAAYRMLLDLRGDLLVPGGNTPATRLSQPCRQTGKKDKFERHVHAPHHKQDLRSETIFTRIHHDTAFCPEEDKEEAC